MRTSLILWIVIPAFAALAQAPTYARERARIDSLVAADVSGTPIAGVAVAVVKARDTIIKKGWGFADLENDVPVTPMTVFRIGSITKQFTSSAIMQLVEKGRLSLEDTLGALLPDMPAAWRMVTLRQLLNHTSGIPSYTDIGMRWRRRWRDDMLPDTILALVTKDSMVFAPGSKWRYNNTGYVLLGMILDKTAGRLYPRYLDEQFFKPLGMSSTMYCYPQQLIKHRAQGYDRVGTRFVNTEYLAMTQPYSAGALCSTVGDLVTWTRALHTGKVVSAPSFTLMTTPLGAAAAPHYGFGIAVDSLRDHPRVAHGGGINGFLTQLAYYPKDSLIVVVLANSAPSPVDLMAGNIARIMLGLPLEGVRQPRVMLSASDMAQYAGDYDVVLPNGNKLPLHVSVSGERLMAQGEGQGTFELIPYGNHTFGADFDRSLRVTFRLQSNRVTSVVVHQGGVDMEGPRR